MRQGIGGAFCGLYVDQQGTHWQPDMGYMLYDTNHITKLKGDKSIEIGDSIGVFVRDDLLLVSSPITGGITAFTAIRELEELSTATERANAVANDVNQAWESSGSTMFLLSAIHCS